MELKRVDRWLKERFPSLTQRHQEEALKAGWVRDAQGKRLKKGDRVGETAPDCAELERVLRELRAGDATLQIPILHETPDIWVVDKPPGVASQPLSLVERGTVTHWAFAASPAVEKAFPEIQPELAVHRLDIGTSGCLVVAKNPDAFAHWRRVFSRHLLRKEYLFWAWGAPKKNFAVKLPLENRADRPERVAIAQEGGTRAETRVEVLRSKPERGIFLGRATMETGFRHQVRAHLAFSGFPLVGDRIYDREATLREIQAPYHALRAIRIEGAGLEVRAPETPFTEMF